MGKFDRAAFLAEFRAKRLNSLIRQGFPATLTEEQAAIIQQPMDAPENYYCDGEITAAQAKARWIKSLKESGLNDATVKMAVKYIGV
jgi:hypothetical protein